MILLFEYFVICVLNKVFIGRPVHAESSVTGEEAERVAAEVVSPLTIKPNGAEK